MLACTFVCLLHGCGAQGHGDAPDATTPATATTAVGGSGATSDPSVTTDPDWSPEPVPSSSSVDPAVPPTTAVAVDVSGNGTSDPSVTEPVVLSDGSVRALMAALDLGGDIEPREGERGPAQCVGRLEPRGLCVNTPLWGLWQFWDVDAQAGPGATEEQASSVAIELFARIAVDPGTVVSIERSGSLTQVTFGHGALVLVASDGRIASVIAPTSLVPVG